MKQLPSSLAAAPTDFWEDHIPPRLALELLPLLRAIGGRCHGYPNGCQCAKCQDRTSHLIDGRLLYDQSGKLRPPSALPHPRQPWELAA